jgi:paraquat-inducible protein B
MPDPTNPQPPVPEARAVTPRKTRLSLVWIVPIVAALAGAWVAVTRILAEGPKITIVFQSAEGLEAGKTKIQYNGVDIGTITTIRLSDDHRNVVTTAQMAPKTEDFLVDDTSFWVVRPRISGANVSGLSTLISGAYIGVEIGASKKARRDFTALETPPVVTGDVVGRFFRLQAADLGSLDTGTPIFFRRLQVGEVASYKLDADGKTIDVKIFVKAPYDQYVTPNTRFWQASGVDVSLSANGFSVQTQSLLSILVGGIAFETPASGPALPPADADSTFSLYGNRGEAFKLPARSPQTFLLVFKESVRGLTVGAPVEFQGIQIGEVSEITAQVDAKTFQFSVPVTVRLDAQRLGVKVLDLAPGQDLQVVRREMMDSLVAHGVRAQLRTGSMLTGGLYVALDFFPDAAPATIDWAQTPVRLPTIPGELEQLEARVASIIKKVDKLPFQQIGDDLAKALAGFTQTLAGFDQTLATARTTLDDANKLIQPNSVLGEQLGSTLQEVSRAARSLRGLTDYLERHPEALIRGKTGEAK